MQIVLSLLTFNATVDQRHAETLNEICILGNNNILLNKYIYSDSYYRIILEGYLQYYTSSFKTVPRIKAGPGFDLRRGVYRGWG